jgi:hypothetical protein
MSFENGLTCPSAALDPEALLPAAALEVLAFLDVPPFFAACPLALGAAVVAACFFFGGMTDGPGGVGRVQPCCQF